jgi:hypothetical protein
MGRLAITVVFIVGIGCLLCPGCAPAYRDPATGVEARYEWETLRAELDQPISEVYYAARDAAEDLDLRPLRYGLDGIAAEIIALDAHHDMVNIRLNALPKARSRLTIRIGLFGDKNKSVVLFGEIMERLAHREGAFSKYLTPNDDRE